MISQEALVFAWRVLLLAIMYTSPVVRSRLLKRLNLLCTFFQSCCAQFVVFQGTYHCAPGSPPSVSMLVIWHRHSRYGLQVTVLGTSLKSSTQVYPQIHCQPMVPHS